MSRPPCSTGSSRGGRREREGESYGVGAVGGAVAAAVVAQLGCINWRRRGQERRWSLVRPAACMNEWMTAEPAKRKPLRTMSLLMASDLEVFTGIFRQLLYRVEMGRWFTKPQKYSSSDPTSLLTCTTAEKPNHFSDKERTVLRSSAPSRVALIFLEFIISKKEGGLELVNLRRK